MYVEFQTKPCRFYPTCLIYESKLSFKINKLNNFFNIIVKDLIIIKKCLRREWLKFKRDRFESWKKLMEDKGEQKENQFNLEVQLQREKFEFKKEQFYLKEKKRIKREGRYK